MSVFKPGTKYGLILSNKGAAAASKPATSGLAARKKPSIFNQSDSDSDKSDGDDWVKKSMKTTAAKSSGLKKQTKIVMAQAMEEDPTVFQYDEVYDNMEAKKEEVAEKKKEVDRKPKYIKQLLKSAEIRNKENERRIERQVQKEREAEGEMYADKEKFVTSAYRAKMEEMAKEQEEEERKTRIEAALDVTRQNDLSGFYRHLYRQTHGEERSEFDDNLKKEEEDKIKKEVEDQIKKEKEEEESLELKAQKVKEQMKKIKVEEEDTEKDVSINIKKVNKKKALRQKADERGSASEEESDSGSSSSSEEETEQQQIKQETLSQEEKLELRRKEMREQKEKREARKRRIEQDESSSDEEENAKDASKQKKSKDKDDENEKDVKMVGQDGDNASADQKPKVDIWKKRTVGDAFEDAIARYWQRVAARRG